MFFEGIGSASVVNGVLRIEAYARNAKGEDVPSGELLVPVGRVVPVVESLQRLIEQIRAEAAKSDADAGGTEANA
jgi:hypothetical protein